MEWETYFAARLEGSFDVAYLESSEGTLYGAGSPVDAVEVFREAVGSEEMERYPDVLIDDWAIFHLLDQAFGLEALVVFEFSDPDDGFAQSVRYDLLDPGGNRVFVSSKSDEGPLLFLAAADRTALGSLLSSLLLTLLGTNTAFGENISADDLPTGIVNCRPDLLVPVIVRRGIELMIERRYDQGAWSSGRMVDQVRKLGNPVLTSVLAPDESPETEAQRRDLADLYFASVYSEAD
jgi:hypothetical protein